MPADYLAMALMAIKNNFLLVYLPAWMAIIIGNRAGINKANKLSLERISKYDGCLINKSVFYDFTPLKQRKRNVDRRKIKELLPYVEKLVNHADESLLTDMYRNLSTVKLKKMKSIFTFGVVGSYDPTDNIIEFFNKKAIGHELLHMASGYYSKEKKEWHVGFKQANNKASIGRGLNEGYTELLASRIYNKSGKAESYENEVRIAKLFELFFDDPKDMEKYYFRHNLPGFILYMQKFIPRKELINMIICLDEIDRIYSRGIVTFTFKTIDLSMKLYKYFLKTNPSRAKIRAFERILRENKFVEWALDKEKFKLQKESTPFNNRVVEMPYSSHGRMRAA